MKPSKSILPFLTALAASSLPLQAATINLDLTTNNPDPITLAEVDNTFSFADLSVDYLIVAGGGAGGGTNSAAVQAAAAARAGCSPGRLPSPACNPSPWVLVEQR